MPEDFLTPAAIAGEYTKRLSRSSTIWPASMPKRLSRSSTISWRVCPKAISLQHHWLASMPEGYLAPALSKVPLSLVGLAYAVPPLFRSRRIGRGAQRFGIMPSHGLQLPTHRSMSLAIRHHAITRSYPGAQVARLDSPASCLRA